MIKRRVMRSSYEGGSGEGCRLGLLKLREGIGQASQVSFQGKVAEENFTEAIASLAGHQRRHDIGNLFGSANIHQPGIVGREQFRKRAPARGQNGQPKGHRLDEIHRLVFVFVEGWKTKQIGFAQ